MIVPFTDTFSFLWYVEEEGYEWTKGADSEPRLLGRGGHGSRIQPYEPLRNSGLFLEFAALKPSQKSLLKFAECYGDLFDQYGQEDLVLRGTRIEGGAPLKVWKDEIADMHALVHLWEAITSRNIKALKTIITWNGNGVRYVIKTPKGSRGVWLAHVKLDKARLARFKPGDVLLPARYALQAEINKRVADPITLSVPRLVWTTDYHQRIIFTPSNLLAAMWLQFAQVVTGEYQLKRCEGCGKYFQAGPGGRRADALTCKDACRQRKRRRDSKP
jgi:hypothetical protein